MFIGTAGTLAATGAALALWATRRMPPTHGEYHQLTTLSGKASPLFTSDTSVLTVYRADQLIQGLALSPILIALQQRSNLSQQSFSQDVMPMIEAVAELVQLLPASESHHHAQPGGLLIHTLESTNFALSIRQGLILPTGAHAEQIGEDQHRWTVAVIAAALLHDIGKPLTDILTTAKGAKTEFEWNPMTGSLVQCNALTYQLKFNTARKYLDHQSLGIHWLRIIPQQTMQWMSHAPGLYASLATYLSGQAPADHVIGAIVTKADGESVRNNLISGTRSRFTAAKAEPLIELFMQALREMLAQGSYLPLNRAGAAGWVYQGDIWFVSKRLIDDVRAYSASHNKTQGFPGTDRNDRIFDTLLDYGAITKNPMNNRAIWSVRVQLLDGWHGAFTVLRVPLTKLFEDSLRYPPVMAGSIEVVTQGAVDASSTTAVATVTSAITNDAIPIYAATPTELPVTLCAAAVRGDIMKVVEPPFTVEAIENAPASKSESEPPSSFLLAALGLPSLDAPLTIPSQEPTLQLETNIAPVAMYLSEIDSAPTASLSNRRDNKSAVEPANAESTAPEKKSLPQPMARAPQSKVLPPVVPAAPVLALLKPKLHVETPPIAQLFMRWIQEGVASGTLPVNTSKSLVHFAAVEHESLGNVGAQETFMLLVSPFVFNQFAQVHTEHEATTVQKQVFKAGWHVTITPGNINILRFNILNKAGKKLLLSCVAIRNPERFVNPLPPVNSVLEFNPQLTAPQNKWNAKVSNAGADGFSIATDVAHATLARSLPAPVRRGKAA